MRDAVLRDLLRGRVWRAHACHVVEDRRDLVALFIPRGAPARLPVDHAGAPLRLPTAGWRLAESRARRDSLGLFRPGAAHSVWLFWEDGWRVPGWYVNFEEPLRRTPVGFDYRDLMLDLVIEGDGSWRWKDEDELEAADRLGLLDAAAVRLEARRVLAERPWPTDWEDWRPDPSWRTPSLPEGWNRVDGSG